MEEEAHSRENAAERDQLLNDITAHLQRDNAPRTNCIDDYREVTINYSNIRNGVPAQRAMEHFFDHFEPTVRSPILSIMVCWNHVKCVCLQISNEFTLAEVMYAVMRRVVRVKELPFTLEVGDAPARLVAAVRVLPVRVAVDVTLVAQRIAHLMRDRDESGDFAEPLSVRSVMRPGNVQLHFFHGVRLVDHDAPIDPKSLSYAPHGNLCWEMAEQLRVSTDQAMHTHKQLLQMLSSKEEMIKLFNTQYKAKQEAFEALRAKRMELLSDVEKYVAKQTSKLSPEMVRLVEKYKATIVGKQEKITGSHE